MAERHCKGKKLLTVLVPVYNVENYLRQCLESLAIEELLDKIEVLIIDDGSPDCSYKIAEAYQKQYPSSFRLIRKENGGHGSTINRGIREATGKYFKVLDGDDWVNQEAFVNLILYLETAESDIVYSNYVWFYEQTGSEKQALKEAFAGVVYGKDYAFEGVCDKLYIKMHSMTIKTSILRDNRIQLDEHCYYVDTEYVIYPIPFVQTISFINENVYMYRVGLSEQSVNLRNMQKRISEHLKVIRSLIVFYKDCFKNELPDQSQRLSKERKKQSYILKMIGYVMISQYKIYLSFPPSKAIKEQLISFDAYIRNSGKDLYQAAANQTVQILRFSGFKLYPFIVMAVRCAYRKQL